MNESENGHARNQNPRKTMWIDDVLSQEMKNPHVAYEEEIDLEHVDDET